MTQREHLEREWLILLEHDTWASAVRRRLQELGRTQEDLARAINVPLTRVNRHLNGVGGPKDSEMRAVAEVLADWARGRFLSAPDLAYIVDPKPSPQRDYGMPWIVESPLLRVAA